MNMSPYICNSCKTISTPILDSRGGWKYKLQPSFQVLQQSAEKGYISCKVFKVRLENIVRDHKIDKFPYDTPVVLRTFSGDAYVRYGPESRLVGEVRTSLQEFSPVNYIGPTADCEENIILMSSLVKNCLKNHGCSYTATSRNVSPTRLFRSWQRSGSSMPADCPWYCVSECPRSIHDVESLLGRKPRRCSLETYSIPTFSIYGTTAARHTSKDVPRRSSDHQEIWNTLPIN
jgi:hypothetical protein